LTNFGSGDGDFSFSLFCFTKVFFNSGFLNVKSGDFERLFSDRLSEISGLGLIEGFLSGTNNFPCGFGGGG
jgi:hypothetical protein